MVGIPSVEEMTPVARKLKEYVGDERIVLYPCAYGGYKIYRFSVRQALDNAGVDYVTLPLIQSRSFDEGYRKIKGIAEDPEKDDTRILHPKDYERIIKARTAVILDDGTFGGSSGVGTAVYVLENRDCFGLERLYTLVDEDFAGFAHFARRKHHERVDLRELMKRLAPKKSGELGERVLRLIGDYPAEGDVAALESGIPRISADVARSENEPLYSSNGRIDVDFDPTKKGRRSFIVEIAYKAAASAVVASQMILKKKKGRE